MKAHHELLAGVARRSLDKRSTIVVESGSAKPTEKDDVEPYDPRMSPEPIPYNALTQEERENLLIISASEDKKSLVCVKISFFLLLNFLTIPFSSLYGERLRLPALLPNKDRPRKLLLSQHPSRMMIWTLKHYTEPKPKDISKKRKSSLTWKLILSIRRVTLGKINIGPENRVTLIEFILVMNGTSIIRLTMSMFVL